MGHNFKGSNNPRWSGVLDKLIIASQEGKTIDEAYRELGIPKTTAHRLAKQYNLTFQEFIINPLDIAFWKRVQKRGEDECWEWQSDIDKYGYGVLNGRPREGFRKIKYKAHRMAWEFTNGCIPDGLCVCHSCDNPPCCNPNHLWLGTSQENTADMVKKGRSAHNRAEEKLTESEVLIIREMSGTNDEIAKMFGVSRRAINAVRNYESWRHLSDTP